MKLTKLHSIHPINTNTMTSHVNPFAANRSSGGHDEVNQDFEAQDVLLGNDSDEDADEEDYASIQRRRRKYKNASIGELYQLNNSRHNNNESSSLSFNTILLSLIGLLAVFGLGYYQLSKHEQRRNHANELREKMELERLKEKYGLVELNNKAAEEQETISNPGSDKESTLNESTQNIMVQQQHENESTTSKQSKPHEPDKKLFDPFHLHNHQTHNQQQINSHTNDWFGAPFIVSPPQLPSSFIANSGENTDGTSSRRMGYFQYPTIFNSTLVFSSEGDLYLTTVPKMNSTYITLESSMPAMKLTTTVGNAIHPKLNHRYPHLLAYSATYSGVREVYLLDLRGVTSSNSQIPTNIPGTPGGPALRLTYTTGGIRSVVGWDEDGTSILYSAWSDQVAMWDIRLFRLRLSSVGGVVREDDTNNTTIDAGKNESFGKGKEVKDSVGAKNHTIAIKSDGKSNNSSSPVNPDEESEYTTKHEKKTEHDKKGDDDKRRRRTSREQERQRRHTAKLMSSQSRRGTAGSAIHPIIEPVPLSEAVEGAYYTNAQNGTGCIFFTRVKQSSSTKRYVGGTAENLWAYCPGEFDDLAIPLTADYNGTSKSPTVYSHGGFGDWIFFMSDRALHHSESVGNGNKTIEWVASSIDLWAAQLPITQSGFSSIPKRLTNIACKFNGMELMEYAVDQSSGAAVLRIGADLHYIPMETIIEKLYPSKQTTVEYQIQQLPIAVYSDFSSMQERIIPLKISDDTVFDAYATSYGVSTLLTARGQTFVLPVIPDPDAISNYGGSRNMPPRRYKVAPGTGGEGLVRILSALNVPLPKSEANKDSGERFALVLATDPLSPTGEHAFYVIRTDAMASPSFGFAPLYGADSVEEDVLPLPFLGGHLESGGSKKDGGLGSVYPQTVTISPCGRRFAFTTTDGQIVIVTVPTDRGSGHGRHLAGVDKIALPWENEIGQPMIGDSDTNLVFSPGGRYLAIEHSAKNSFKVISIADLESPELGHLQLGRIVQVTSDRFNSFSVVWGRESKDFAVKEYTSKLASGDKAYVGGSTALYFLSDRDIILEGATSPWGTRAPSPRFDGKSCVHILPLQSLEDAIENNEVNAYVRASFGGGGVSEVAAGRIQELKSMMESMNDVSMIENEPEEAVDNGTSNDTEEQLYVIDTPISFAEKNDASFRFARTAYRIDSIPAGSYAEIVCQLADDPSLLIVTQSDDDLKLSLLATVDYPSDHTKDLVLYNDGIEAAVMNSDRTHVIILISGEELQVIRRDAKQFLSLEKDTNMAFTNGLHLNVWPALEYQQMYTDSWRLLRDYFYDSNLHDIEWDEVFDRYLPLVERCGKREELDDVMRQMGGELSALHVFVKGGEKSSPNHGSKSLNDMNEIASLGATLRRSIEMNGYEVIEIPERDPDFHMIDREPVCRPFSSQSFIFFIRSSFSNTNNMFSSDVLSSFSSSA